MPRITVLLIRHAESIVDSGEAKRLHETLDPGLTDEGYRTAHEFWRTLFAQQLVPGPRKLACFSAPLMACHSTALLLSAADMPKFPDLSWRLTVAETAKTPTAVPILVHNNLASFNEEYSTLDKILAAGLLHGAAADWNNAQSRKCPLAAKLDQVQAALSGDRNFLQRWKQDRTVHPPHKVLEAQFLHQTDPEHWWSLQPLTSKRNLLVDLLAPNKYLPPPRRGMVQSMLDHTATESAHDPVQAVQDCLISARRAGCDTVLMILPAPTIVAAVQELIGSSNSDISVSPLSLTSCTVDIESMEWNLVCGGKLPTPEPIDCTDIPPADIDPASVPANQWSVFPIPEPENIPDDYPDLPPFGMALSKPPPGAARPESAPLRERPNNHDGPTDVPTSPQQRTTGIPASRASPFSPDRVVRSGPSVPMMSPGRSGRGGRDSISPTVRTGHGPASASGRGGRVRPPIRGGRAGPRQPPPANAGRGGYTTRSPLSPTPHSPGRAPANPAHGGCSPGRTVSPASKKLSHPHPPPHSPGRAATSATVPSIPTLHSPTKLDDDSSPPTSPQPLAPEPTTPTRLPKQSRKSKANHMLR